MINKVLLEHIAPPLDNIQQSLLEWTGIHRKPHVKHCSGLWKKDSKII